MSRTDRNQYRPRYDRASPPPPPPRVGKDMYQFGGGPRARSDFSFRPRISERKLLTRFPDPAEVPVLGANHAGHKFKDVGELTDSDEEPMDEDTENEEESRYKRRKLENGTSLAKSTSKWSNPDPYTSLPPASEASGKRVDVVKLIRKARNDATSAQSIAAEQDDFISFDDFVDYSTFSAPSNAPAGPKADLFSRIDPSDRVEQTLGKRKRRDDHESTRLMGAPNRAQFHANGMVLAAWRPSSSVSSTPWLQTVREADLPVNALHKEILDFYAWVKPREFEHTVREDLIRRLSKELNRSRSGQLQSFGSYAAGLYLPTGDMDLVYNLSGGVPISKHKMYDIGSFISNRTDLAEPGSLVVIAKAKVPIIKYVDALTGIKVDLSFNNNTGIVAIDTFNKWQAMYPALAIIVSVIKQSLMIRGLNDNSVGGFGGFATICMVTSLIQNLPTTNHQNLGELLLEFFNLYGNLLDVRRVGIRLEPPGFINKNAYPPLRDEKPERLMIIDPNRPDNNITGGSTEVHRIFNLFSKMHDILQQRLDDFEAHSRDEASFSFLSDIIGGDFTAYHDQRRGLQAVFQQLYPNKAQAVPPPPPPSHPPPPIEARPPPPPSAQVNGIISHRTANKHDDESTTETNDTNISTTSRKSRGERLLARLRRLLPNGGSLDTRTTITIPEALKLGAWGDRKQMYKELEKTEKLLSKAEKRANAVRK